MDKKNHTTSQSPLNDQRLPVPHYMRTRRVAPRVLAGVATLAWLSCFAYGSLALARIETTAANKLEQPLALGETFWALRNPLKGERCAGYLLADLQQRKLPGAAIPEQTTLKLNGTIRVGLREKIVRANAEALGLFDEQFELLSMHAQVQLEEGSVTFSLPTSQDELSASMKVGDFSHKLNFGRIGKIYLVQDTAEQYRLRFPKALRGLLQERGPGIPRPPMEMVMLEKDEISTCRAEAEDESNSAANALIDIGEYLSLIKLAAGANNNMFTLGNSSLNTRSGKRGSVAK